jgi:hypothetical protein
MQAIEGIYHNGYIKLLETPKEISRARVIVTFLEDEKNANNQQSLGNLGEILDDDLEAASGEHQKNDREIQKEARKNDDTENDAAEISKIEREDYRRFQEAMLAEGLISEIKPLRDAARYEDFPPLDVEGKPASESIIEERR